MAPLRRTSSLYPTEKKLEAKLAGLEKQLDKPGEPLRKHRQRLKTIQSLLEFDKIDADEARELAEESLKAYNNDKRRIRLKEIKEEKTKQDEIQALDDYKNRNAIKIPTLGEYLSEPITTHTFNPTAIIHMAHSKHGKGNSHHGVFKQTAPRYQHWIAFILAAMVLIPILTK